MRWEPRLWPTRWMFPPLTSVTLWVIIKLLRDWINKDKPLAKLTKTQSQELSDVNGVPSWVVICVVIPVIILFQLSWKSTDCMILLYFYPSGKNVLNSFSTYMQVACINLALFLISNYKLCISIVWTAKQSSLNRTIWMLLSEPFRSNGRRC